MNVDAQVHLHVIPRYATTREWNGTDFRDVHWGVAAGHEQRVLDTSALRLLAAEIRTALYY
jgi:diadenosine tetraphosphate (Ap4A) HIT family hydrolase